MKITELKLKNFGVYEEKLFRFSKFSVLLDKNGTGKSTVLRALNFALDGDYKEDMVREDQTEMSVSIAFENGLIVTRAVKNGKVAHRMGYDNTTRASTKEKVNTAIAEMTNTDMENLKVVASSSDIFRMKPDELANFFMSNIPNTMTTDKAISYIEDITPPAEKKVRSLLPADGEFGIETIRNVYDALYEERRDLTKVIRNDQLVIGNYDFNVSIRESKAVQEDLAKAMKRIGEMEARNKQVKEWNQLRDKRTQTLETLRKIQNEVKEIVVTGIPKGEKERQMVHGQLKQNVDTVTSQIVELNRNIAATEPVIRNTESIIARLKEGMCPQLKGMKCPNDWSGKIHDFEAYLGQLNTSLNNGRNQLESKKKELADTKAKLDEFERQLQLLAKKQSLTERFKALRPTLQDLPEEPKPVDMNRVLLEKSDLEKELRLSLRHEQLLEVYKTLPEKNETYRILERLVEAFSPKGDILTKNLKFYLDFFEKQINEKAAELGYVIHFDSKNGLFIQIGKKGHPAVGINNASGGEKAIALFLLLDLFNSITGVNLLFFDEVEVLDSDVFEALICLIKEKMPDYDHIVIAGVDHTDTMNTIKKYFS